MMKVHVLFILHAFVTTIVYDIYDSLFRLLGETKERNQKIIIIYYYPNVISLLLLNNENKYIYI